MWRVKDLINKLKWKHQRAKRGYSDCDSWDISSWFLEVMPQMLDALEKERHGYPCDLDDGRWSYILKRMAYCFREANEETCSEKNQWEDLYALSSYEEKDGSITFTPVDDDLYQKWITRSREIDDYRYKMLDEGMDLFKKYFWQLWD